MLTFEKIPLRSASLGLPNVIPDIKTDFAPANPLPATVDNGMEEIEGAWVAQGKIHTMLPYTTIDGYDRTLKDSTLDVAVLENEYLRAEFATALGGRLWSLYDKKRKKDLLFRNHVFQPANLGLRNAWFSGGTEWNIGIIGHHPFTTSPVFVARYPNAAGGETLKLYEFERIRGLVYTVRAALKDDQLLVRVNIENSSDKATYVYWWSNMAVEQTPDTLVIVPANEYYEYTYGERNHASAVKMPPNGFTPAKHANAFDYFFRIPKEKPKYVAAVEKDGKGFVQVSTKEMIGRKLFVWGTESQGGRHWNQWLQRDERTYAEIQAGLLHSQAEQAPMPAHSSYEWTEGYSAFGGDPFFLRDTDPEKRAACAEKLLKENGRFASVENADPWFQQKGEEKIVSFGSGWGALTEAFGGKKLSAINVFPPESILPSSPEADFLALLTSGAYPTKSPLLTENTCFDYVGGACRDVFLPKMLGEKEKSWFSYLELACLFYEAKNYEEAKKCFLLSVEKAENAPALSSLAKMAAAEGKTEEGIAFIKRAAKVGGEYVRTVIDAMKFLHRFGKTEDVEEVVRNAVALHPDYLKNGRIALITSQNLLKQGKIEESEKMLLSAPEIADIREGEISTSEIWESLYRAVIARDEKRSPESIFSEEVFEKYPIPEEIDFRMK